MTIFASFACSMQKLGLAIVEGGRLVTGKGEKKRCGCTEKKRMPFTLNEEAIHAAIWMGHKSKHKQEHTTQAIAVTSEATWA
jgi:hypothetical protein